jgi:hypothetical protein
VNIGLHFITVIRVLVLISTVLTLETMKSLDQSLGWQTSLGVSPIWFLEVVSAVTSDRLDEMETDFLTNLTGWGSMRSSN